MKKVLLCMVLAGLMMPAVAQMKMNEVKTLRKMPRLADKGITLNPALPTMERYIDIPVEGWVAVGLSESYDRQSQGSVYPMGKLHKDGQFIGFTWTNNDNPIFPGPGGTDVPYRGIGYSYSTDGGKTWSYDPNNPDNPGNVNRVGGIPLYWPSYAQWGPDGEVIMGRSMNTYEHNGIPIKDGLVLLTRETKGEGEWKIVPIPYPEDVEPGYFMAWARMVTSGDNNEYIHVMTGMRNDDNSNATYEGLTIPIVYNRTHDGGETWDFGWHTFPTMAGVEWDDDHISNTDDYSWAEPKGSNLAAIFSDVGMDGVIMKSTDHGETWEQITFFKNILDYYAKPSEGAPADTVFAPYMMNDVAFDNNGKLHAVFAVCRFANSDSEGELHWWYSYPYHFLAYWNEDMGPYESVSFTQQAYAALDNWYTMDDDYLYVTDPQIPTTPVIGWCVSLLQPGDFTFMDDALDWAIYSYGGHAGLFTFPHIGFDESNTAYVVYCGVLDGAVDGNTHWIRQLFSTKSQDMGQTWTETAYLTNYLEVIDQEFAYPVLAGMLNGQMYIIVQTDSKAGVSEPYVYPGGADHDATLNTYYFIKAWENIPPGIENTAYTPLTMSVFPNPASGQVTVKFEGKGNITVYNMLGQEVYHVENVENQKDIPLNNLTTGVYFVTVRSGNATATQKLVVK